MKEIYRKWYWIPVVLLALLGTLQVFLQTRLTAIVQAELRASRTPPFEQTTLQNVRFNLLTGQLRATHLAVPNPEAFDMPDMFSIPGFTARIAWPDLVRGIVNIRSLNVPQLTVTIIRNPDGSWNLPWLPGPEVEPAAWVPHEKTLPEKTIPYPRVPEVAPAPTPLPLDLDLPPLLTKRQLHIADATIALQIVYIDRQTSPQAPPLTLKATLHVSDLFTYGYLPEPLWGTVTLTGHAVDAPETFQIDLHAKVAPILQPDEASFTLQGTIAAMDPGRIAPWQEATGIASESIDLRAEIAVADGNFQRTSHLLLTARNASVSADTHRRMRNLELPPVFSVRIPVAGTLQEPSINLVQAITQSLLKNLADNPETLLDQIRIDGKSLRERIRF